MHNQHTKNASLSKFFSTLTSLFFVVFMFGCTDGDDNENKVPIDSDPEHDTPDAGKSGYQSAEPGELLPVVTADQMTSATPGVAEFVQTESHSGWGRADCASCHDSLHTSGYNSGAECAFCHGSNGATLRTVGHNDGLCSESGCHTSTVNTPPHAVSDFNGPNDCRSCHRYETPEDGSCTHTADYDVVIIGAGGGGLSAASQLTRAGKDVLIVEQSYKPGGAMINFVRGDYRIESSLHAMDGIGVSYLSILDIADRLEMVEGENLFQVITPELTFNMPADVAVYEEELIKLFPEHADDLARLFDDMLSMDFELFIGMTVVEALAKYNITLEETTLFTLITSMTGFVAGGLDVIPAPLYVGMWNVMQNMNYAYFVGGSQAITDALVDVITENSGVIKTYTLATDIVIEDGKAIQVKTDDGGCYNADYVISNANEPDTYFKLIKKENLEPEFIETLEAKRIDPTISIVYLGVNADYTHLFPGNGHEIFVFQDYVLTEANQEASACKPEIQGFGITNYSVLDPTAAPAGKNVITIIAGMEYECYDEWRFDESWESYKSSKWEFAKQFIDKAEVHLPDLSKHIEVLEICSPQTIKAYTKTPKGSWSGYRVDPGLGDPMDMTLVENHLTPFPNVFQTGAWVTEGGQSTVLMSGDTTAQLILDPQDPQ